MNPTVVRYRRASEFLERARDWLLEAEDRNNLILSLALGLAHERSVGPDAAVDGRDTTESDPGMARPFFATVEGSGGVAGCALRTPAHPVLLTDMPALAARPVAHAVADVCASIPTVLGPPPLAESFADEWVSIRDGVWRPGTDQRLYRLNEVTALPAPGELKLGKASDAVLATVWSTAFARELHMHQEPLPETVAAWIDQGFLFLWVHRDVPVSMAVAHGLTPRGVRIGYVYTPPELRRRGYAGACVAAVSQHLLDFGFDFCVLYADLSNPTTTELYQKMGYRPVADLRECRFFPSEAPS